MKFHAVAYYEFIKNIRDLKMAMILIIFPIIMILIIGNALGSIFDREMTVSIKSGYVNNGTGVTAKTFNEYLNGNEIKDKLELIRFSNEASGQEALKKNEIDTLILLPDDIDSRLAEGKKQFIRLYGNEKLTFVENLVKSYTDLNNAYNALLSVKGIPVEVQGGSVLKRIYYNKDAATPNSISYYSVLTLLQLLFMGSMFGINITSKTHASDIHVRIHSLPLSGLVMTGGRVAGSTLYLVLASVFTIAVSKYVYHANWDGNLAVIIGTMLLFCMLTVGMGMILGLLFKGYSMALMSTLILMLFFASIAGAFTPSSSIAFLSGVSPMYHAKILLFGTIYGYSGQIMMEALLWLSAQTFAVFGLAAFLSRRVRYDNI